MDTVLFALSMVFGSGLLVFLIIQWATNHRSPLALFKSSLSFKEFNMLLGVINSAKMDCFTQTAHGPVFKNGTYHITCDWQGSYRVNSVNLSLRQEYRLKRTIERRVLEVNKLTTAGKALY